MDFLGLLLIPIWACWQLAFSRVALVVSTSVILAALITFISKQRSVDTRRKVIVQPSLISAEVIQIPSTGTSSIPEENIITRDHRHFCLLEIFKTLPVHPKNGWCLNEVNQGLRLFSRFFPALCSTTSSGVLAGATLVDVKPQRALALALSTSEFSTWMSMVRGIVQQIKKPHHSLNKLTCSADSDIISITYQTSQDTYNSFFSMVLSWLHRYGGNYFLSWFGFSSRNSDFIVEMMERSWDCRDDRLCHLLSVTSQMSFLPYFWSLLIFSSVPNHNELSMATLVALPCSNSAHSATRKCITAQLCALREYILMKKLRVYASSSAVSVISHVPDTDNQISSKSSVSSNNTIIKHEPPLSEPSVSQTEVKCSPKDQYAEIDEKYLNMAKQCTDNLLRAASATEQDGWSIVGTSKNVFIMKKTAAKDEAPINCVKGRGEINCPPDFVMRLIMDPSHAAVLDDMLKDMTILKELSNTMQLVHLNYKAVWPTTARDFSVINVFGRTDAQTRVHCARSVIDPRIPEEKGYVRGDVLSGGYVIKDCPGNPEKADVIYLTQVDLKGSVPAFLINKVVESQPQCVNHLRNIAEAEYNKLRRNPVKMKQFEEDFPIHYIPKDASELNIELPGDVCSRSIIDDSIPQQSLTVTVEVHDIDKNTLGHDDSSMLTPIVSDETAHPSIDAEQEDLFGERRVPTIPMAAVLKKLPRYRSEGTAGTNIDETGDVSQSRVQVQHHSTHVIEYPRTGQEIDYRTLGNQSAARMLEELFNVSELDLGNPATFTDQQNGWNFMGKGIIELPPQEIYNCVRNPNQRFTFDSMLKELHIVKQIEDGLYILHLHHEMTQCFLKQARDFCLLVCERSEPNKKLIVGSSVDVSDCPPQHNVTRGKINTSGWVIEPYRHGERLCTQVTYLVQVDTGGIPTAIVNMIGRRQPLAIAYLRDYLQATSLNYTNDRLIETEFTNSMPTLIFKT